MVKHVKWWVGLTTVPDRMNDLLPATLRSLAAAGWSEPRLFVDGVGICEDVLGSLTFEGREIVVRHPPVRAFGNFLLAAWELWIRACAVHECSLCGHGEVVEEVCSSCRQPEEMRFLLTQDDVAWCKNVRQYLERMTWPGPDSLLRNTGTTYTIQPVGTYLNLYTYSTNEPVVAGKPAGTWHEAGLVHGTTDRQRLQTGRGAVALVFDARGMKALLSAPTIVRKPLHPTRGHQAVDGGVVTAMNLAGFREMVHNPSLVRHTGTVSMTRTRDRGQPCKFPYEPDLTFPGEDHDALLFLRSSKDA